MDKFSIYMAVIVLVFLLMIARLFYSVLDPVEKQRAVRQTIVQPQGR